MKSPLNLLIEEVETEIRLSRAAYYQTLPAHGLL